MTDAIDWRRRGLDVLLFLLTIASLAVTFWETVPDWVQMSVLSSFVVLFAVRWHIAESRRTYIRQNWFDLVFVVLLASPVLRLFSALRFVRVLPALKLGTFLHNNRKRLLRLILLSRDSFPVAMAIIFGMVFLFGSCTFLIEHGQNPGFEKIEDGLWWAFVTLTTVGYGDIVPHTEMGRIVAVMLMVFGVAVYALMIANLTHYLDTIDRNHDQTVDPAALAQPIPVSDVAPSPTKRND
ncbi:MAG: potassium channel protein [Zetaproteobacteria bacterium CG12_big_fil_rev_8_21_14_0_65_55_1124]|nr:MAG: potassium channel protein [Zetaproteobacteria bacterium CG1_02_55_237]PIS19740.1 MAG: potassium channel protein [Zetaproteobacteria bacterium CG08_land_8_20_14_0_20_55_17]PIW43506.1 MAG: potassium channel protein [Zetaproteobacteria bacterium CG12_big_fil_rev_8_21_14_0_65_55_1124]PIY54136.1 MAG: potassium channel protein [Zetaproteobacteria bacterium CG_4_10_14_0_8_um_filter_55_43]PIZ39131.1 MAG: potassium channel protein [Zetaproteobacteria bacterium CG_4_10_14_0_2_um_filter_55_20]PJB